MESRNQKGSVSDREISLADGLIPLPERLLLAHARGKVLFIAGAGISTASKLPTFSELVVDVYESSDLRVHKVLNQNPGYDWSKWDPATTDLAPHQIAEVRRFISGDYDVVLGMLERRSQRDSSNHTSKDKSVRLGIAKRLSQPGVRPAKIHKALLQLADRGAATTILTTNFDLLLERSATRGTKVSSYSLGSIPRPTLRDEFSGVMHIHGSLNRNPAVFTDLVVSDQDFGEYYLRRRVVPDLIYDAARLFHIVLAGYSANDPPMRYLLNAVAADGTRFDDLKERFSFVSSKSQDMVQIEDWKGRGITPIQYLDTNSHEILLRTLVRWSQLSPSPKNEKAINALIRSLTKVTREKSTQSNRDLFDHLYRRSNATERQKIALLVSQEGAHISWLEAMTSVERENQREYSV